MFSKWRESAKLSQSKQANGKMNELYNWKVEFDHFPLNILLVCFVLVCFVVYFEQHGFQQIIWYFDVFVYRVPSLSLWLFLLAFILKLILSFNCSRSCISIKDKSWPREKREYLADYYWHELITPT